MRSLLLVLSVLILLSSASSCYNDKYDKLYPADTTGSATTACDTTTISYSHDIAPIVASNCFSAGNGCHDATGSSVSGYDYTTYTGFTANIPGGVLLNDLNWTPTKGHNDMPKNAAQLPSCDINKITRWINEGYPNN